jgi:hypothetical protein
MADHREQRHLDPVRMGGACHIQNGRGDMLPAQGTAGCAGRQPGLRDDPRYPRPRAGSHPRAFPNNFRINVHV